MPALAPLLLSLALLAPQPLAAHASLTAAAPAAPVTKRLAVVMIQNGDTAAEQTQLADEAFARNIFFGPSGSLATWMPAVTHGLLQYAPAGDGVYLVQPNDALRTGDRSTCLSEAARATAEDHLRTTAVAWDAVAVLFDIGSGCKWAGLGQMPGKVTWYPPKPSLSAIVHEFGHNQGYPHEPKRDCTSGLIADCKPNDYSGNTPMGSGGAARGYSSVELLHSKWIEPDWLTQTGKPGTYTLKPLYSPASVAGTRVVEFTTSGSASYVVETRARGDAVDSGVTNAGIRVYAVTGHDYKNAYMVNPGASSVITDAANKIVITIRSTTSVSLSALEASAAPPTSAPSPSAVPSVEPSPSSNVDDDIFVEGAPPVSSDDSSSGPPWIAFGVALISLGGLGVAFLFLGQRGGKHRRRWGIGA